MAGVVGRGLVQGVRREGAATSGGNAALQLLSLWWGGPGIRSSAPTSPGGAGPEEEDGPRASTAP
eukprot:7233543-Pyramimonas_sp.AAC.1